MKLRNKNLFGKEPALVAGLVFLIVINFIVLKSIADFVYPEYFAYYLVGILVFIVFSKIDFEVFEAFYFGGYILSIVLLGVLLVVGEVTRGVVRWIEIGPWSLQPVEIVRPLLILFIAKYFTKKVIDVRRFVGGSLMFFVPLMMILVQPSLGVAVLTTLGFIGVVLSLDFNKRMIFTAVILAMAFAPMMWFVMAPYQKDRVKALFSSDTDPYGTGYNSIQSKIAVGSGKIWGRGLGEGVQTQLRFLPERHTDFVFASIAEETGFVGGFLVILLVVFILYRIIDIAGNAENLVARAFAAGVFLTLFSQVLIHIGMNMGIVPITGIPLPVVSAGGSSLVGTMMMLGMVVSAKKRKSAGQG